MNSKNMLWSKGRSTFSTLILTIYWVWLTLKVLAKSDLVEIVADFGVHSSFAKILGFGFGCMQNFTPNLNHLLSMANPESLSSIRLMVETVDTICRTGTGMTHFVITYTSAQLLFDLAWLWLSFVKIC